MIRAWWTAVERNLRRLAPAIAMASIGTVALGCDRLGARGPVMAPVVDATLTPPTPAEAEMAVRLLLVATDPRVNAQRPRAPQIVNAELAGLQRLLQKAGQTDPDRAALLRRLAEEHVELRAAAAREVPRASGSTAGEWAKVERTASQRAQDYFRQLMAEYPDYQKTSDVLFFLGVEQGLHGTRAARAR